VRGFRIEAAEVEAVLRGQPDVVDAFVTAITLPTGDASLTAVIVSADKLPPPSAGALRRACAIRLPGYMIPDRFEMIAAFPTTMNGKTDRIALAEFALRAVGGPKGRHP
jgi:acyl-CoA synthetase (AMP-forming)/AMP-acid ligase II